MSFPQVRTTAWEFPSTLLSLMGMAIPDGMPSPCEELTQRFSPKAIVLIAIDNFGLFEAVVHKPEALIKYMEALALIETDDPYAVPLLNTVFRGSQTSHLLDRIREYGKIVRIICREDDMETFGFNPAYTVKTRDDMTTYIESTKLIAKSDLLFLHFLDFESLYAQYGQKTPPTTLLEKIVRRTDNWIKVLLRQARQDTLFIILGNHGRHPIPLDYEGKLAEWRKANAPIAIMLQKRGSI
ncbi:MAG: alkaline phosphatase family protein [Candidatus Thorarchaeota archaeon]|nr:alkaline phosphatase family protein [Candidatus Thorarchaeota archaeon]